MGAGGGVASIPGWYGKLPSLGDFASRRLESDFIDPWDLWLGEGLQAQRAAFGEQWLDAYLHSPPWRFVLAPGAMPRQPPGRTIAGVLLPSVDRVGRHFPLTIAAPIAAMPRIAAEFDALLAWMHRLEDTALDAVQGGWGIDELEQALAALPPPDAAATAPGDGRLAAVRRSVDQAVRNGGGFVDIASLASRAELAAVFSGEPSAAETSARLPVASLQGRTIWLADAPGRPQLLVSTGLPGSDEFIRLFGGSGGAVDAVPIAPDAAAPAAAVSTAALLPAVDTTEFDDPLATRPQPLGAPLGLAGAAAPDDILALFGAGDASPDGPPPPQGGTGEPDILAMFGVPPAEPDAGKQ